MADNFNILDTPQPVDPFQEVQQTETVDVRQTDEEKLDSGEIFFGSDIVLAVADTNDQEYLIKVGADPIGIVISETVEGKCDARVFEGPTTTANGTAVSLVDCNRTTANTPNTTFFRDPTVTADGTEIAEVLLQSGEKEKSVTSSSARGRSILAANTDYLIRITNRSGGNTDIGTVIEFTEPA